ncbi:heparinase II/III domain-containing protein, partial [Maritalea sp.]|uniref:heparinase II/III domain-containing protein n=1 Tax=Maritalea sp. TaxID=2003361 RepID=UPI003EF806C6
VTTDTYLELAHSYARDWIEKVFLPCRDTNAKELVELALSQQGIQGEDFSWYDMNVSNRCYKIAYLLDALSRNATVEDSRIALILEVLAKHLEVLAEPGFLRNHTNHGLYQMLGRLAGANRFAWMPGWAAQADVAANLLNDMIEQQFFEEGMHKEHSPGYHLKILHSLLRARKSGLIGAEKEPLLARAAEALAWLVTPDGKLVTIGDTAPTDWQHASGNHLDWPSIELTNALAGDLANVPDGLAMFDQSGYASVRRKGSHLVQIAGQHSRTHKHADNLSFVWQENDLPILSDPGRFEYLGRTAPSDPLFQQGFWYSDPRRIYVESTRAHNCVEIDGSSYPRFRVRHQGSYLTSSFSEQGLFAIDSEAIHSRRIRHRRALIFSPGEWLIVLDWLHDRLGSTHDYRQYFQLGAHWKAKRNEAGYVAQSNGHNLTVIDMLGEQNIERVARGQKSPRYQGWHAPGGLTFVPAASLCFAAENVSTARFATLICLGNAKKIAGLSRSNMSMSRVRLAWRQNDQHKQIEFSRGKQGIRIKSPTAC